MKKIGYLLCMFCMLFVSNACSDDDEEGNGASPVTVTSFPSTTITAGEEVSILGTGFARDCEIYLKAAGGDLQKMSVEVATSGVRFKIPSVQTAGVYGVILRQDGNDWELGKITLEALVMQMDNITEREEGDDRVVEYQFTYQPDGKLASIETMYNGEPDQRYDFKWTNAKLAVELYYVDFTTGEYADVYDARFEYALNADGTVQSEEGTGQWSYADGYLAGTSNYTYTYDGGKISVLDDGYGKYDLKYESQANVSVLDLMGVVFQRWNLEEEAVYCARMAGVCGKAPGYLPSSVIMLADPEDLETEEEVLGNVTYGTDPETGYVNKITYDDGVYYEITYKAVR